VLLVIGALLVFGVIMYLNSRDRYVAVPTPEATSTVTTLAPTSASSRGQISLSALMAQNTPQECTYVVEEGGVESTGTVYLGAGAVRVDTATRGADGVLRAASMHYDGTSYYVWGDGMEGGVQVSAANMADMAATPGASTPPLDVERELVYDCTPNTPPASLLTPPSEVTFTNLDEVLQGLPGVPENAADTTPEESGEAGAGAPVDPRCAACEQAGAGRVQCLAALGCE
jgi:hypothetical protein